jgi:hypothetical protein
VSLPLGTPELQVNELGVEGSRIAQLALSRLVLPPLQLVVLTQVPLLALLPEVT